MNALSSFFRVSVPSALLLAVAASATAASSYDWDPEVTGNSLWNDSTNWVDSGGSVPGAGDTANLNVAFAGQPSVVLTATNGFPSPSVGILNVGDSSANKWLLQFTGGSTSVFLTLNNLGSEAQINKTAGGAVYISRRFEFVSDTRITVADSELRFSGGNVRWTGGGSIAVEGSGLLTFHSGATSASFSTAFDGDLSIRSNGTLLVNNTFQASTAAPTAAVTVQNTGHLGGAGTVGRATTVQSGGVLTPGAALGDVGVLTFSDGLSLNAGSAFAFDLRADSVAGRGTTFDGVNVTGGSLTVAEGALFNVTFNGSGSTVDFTSEFWNAEQEWLVFQNAAASSGLFTLGSVSTDSQGNAFDVTGGALGFKQVGNDLYLTYTAVPEPGGTAMFLGSAAAAFAVLRWKTGRASVK